MVRKRDPEQRHFPIEIECVFCGATLRRHCRRCSWYPCKPDKTITRVTSFRKNEDGSIAWLLTHRLTAPEFFSLK